MTYLEQCNAAHLERLQRLSHRLPEAGPARVKPKMKIIAIGRDGMRVRTKLPPPPKPKITFVAPELPAPTVPPPLSMRRIMATVAAVFGAADARITVCAMLSPMRPGWIIEARHVAIYLKRELTHTSWHHLGLLARRDHSSCLHAHKHIAQAIPDNAALAAKIDEVKRRLGR